jgi:nucleoside-diphosphate-sugar epimerase
MTTTTTTMSKVSLIWIAIIVISQIITTPCHAFGDFKLPKFPWESGAAPSVKTNNKALQPGDTIAVVGASGNVGKLLALRLSDTYKVNGIVRDASSESSVQQFFQGREDRIKLFEANLLDEMNDYEGGGGYSASLVSALKNANAIVICTGTTAFPTKAWTKSGETEVTNDVLKALLDNKFSIKDAISSLDQQGLNTPYNIDARANEFIIQAWNSAAKVPQKRAIMLSSIGVKRRDAMPFPILNACGVLDAKATGEEAIINAAKMGGYSYTILRPGQLFGGPYDNNYYLGTLFQLDKDVKTQDVSVGKGDELLGDTLRSTLAEVTAQICEGNSARDMDFAVVNVKGESPSAEAIQERLTAL